MLRRCLQRAASFAPDNASCYWRPYCWRTCKKFVQRFGKRGKRRKDWFWSWTARPNMIRSISMLTSFQERVRRGEECHVLSHFGRASALICIDSVRV